MNALTYKGTPVKALIGTTLGFFFGSAAVSLFGPFHDVFQESMKLTTTQIGVLIAIPSLSGSLLRIPFGAWVDSTGGKKPFFILLVLSLIGMIGMSILLWSRYPDHMDGMYPLILFLGCLCGCGIATFSTGVGQTSYWFAKNKQGGALGIFAGVGTLAPGVFALLLSVTIGVLSIVSIYFIWVGFLLVGVILYYYLARNAPYFQFVKKGETKEESMRDAQNAGEQLFPAGGIIKSLSDSAKIPATWFLVIIYFCTFGGFLALTAWLPTFWNKFYLFDVKTAGVFAAVFSILSALIRVPSGKLSDKMGGVQVLVVSMILLLISAIVISVLHNLAIAIICSILIATALGMGNAATFKLVPRFISGAVGGASGWVGGLGAFGGFVLPQIFSVFIENGAGKGDLNWGYAHSFFVFGILAILNILLLYFGLIIPDRKRRMQEKIKP